MSSTIIAEELYIEALAKWGPIAQKDMALEELGELIVALQHCWRGRATHDDVIEEIADVYIMCDQMSIIFGKDKVQAKKLEKLIRLQKRLNK